MKKLKNYALLLLGYALLILDFGLDYVNPFLHDLGFEEKAANWLKIVFGVYGIWKLKRQLPTQNKEELKELAQDDNICEEDGNN